MIYFRRKNKTPAVCYGEKRLSGVGDQLAAHCDDVKGQ